MEKDDRVTVMLCAITILIALLVPTTGWVVQSHFEAAAYNRITGKSVTTWDAMWLELRVQEPVR